MIKKIEKSQSTYSEGVLLSKGELIMSRSEFRYNKKRKHYAYLFKDLGSKRLNILITSKPEMILKRNKKKIIIFKNISLHHHPNPAKNGKYYLIPKEYVDELTCFAEKALMWNWDRNDKRKVKRIKKKKLATKPIKANHQFNDIKS